MRSMEKISLKFRAQLQIERLQLYKLYLTIDLTECGKIGCKMNGDSEFIFERIISAISIKPLNDVCVSCFCRDCI